MRAVAVLFAGLLVLSSAAYAQSNKDWNDCASEDTDRSLTGCSAIIARGKETKINLAIARANRGNDYQNTGTTSRPSPTTTSRSGSIRKRRTPITIAATPRPSSANTTWLSPITVRR